MFHVFSQPPPPILEIAGASRDREIPLLLRRIRNLQWNLQDRHVPEIPLSLRLFFSLSPSPYIRARKSFKPRVLPELLEKFNEFLRPPPSLHNAHRHPPLHHASSVLPAEVRKDLFSSSPLIVKLAVPAWSSAYFILKFNFERDSKKFRAPVDKPLLVGKSFIE